MNIIEHHERFAGPSKLLRNDLRCHDQLLFDVSVSTLEPGFEAGKRKLDLSQEAGQAFVEQKLRCRPQDYVSILTYSDTATVLCSRLECGADHEEIQAAIQKISRVPNGGTRIEPALKVLVENFKREARDTGPCQLTRCIAYSDGHDAGTSTALKLATQLKELGVLIETFGVGKRPSSVDERFLRKLASTVNGHIHYRFLGDGDTFRETFRALASGTLTFEA